MTEQPILTDDEIMLLEFGTKKKKRKDKVGVSTGCVEIESNCLMIDSTTRATIVQEDIVSLPTYTYEYLLNRVLDQINTTNTKSQNNNRSGISAPTIIKVGSKRIVWTNFNDFCVKTRRNSEHIYHYMTTELGSECSIDGMQRLVIKGRFVPKYIDSLMKNYIQAYVSCSSCFSHNTLLTKDSISRIYFIRCEDCCCVKSVSTIKQGFHAQTRTDRIALRAK